MLNLSYKEYNKVSGIYLIQNLINNKFYIGSSKNIYYRIRGHYHKLFHNNHGNPRLQNAFNKYGVENFIVEVLETNIELGNLLTVEYTYINKLNPFYNLHLSNPSARRITTEETRKLISKASKQKFIDNPQLLIDLSKRAPCGWNKGLKGYLSESHIISLKERTSLRWNNRNETDEKTLEKLKESGKLCNIKRRKPILQLDLNHNLVQTFESLAAAAKYFNKGAGNFVTVIKKQGKLYGYYWKYA